MKNPLYCLIAAASLLSSALIATASETTVWIGMSSPRNGEPEGIYRATLDDQTGAISQPTLAARITSPGYLALHPKGKLLYTVCQFPRAQPSVAVFEIADDEQSLRPLDTEPIDDGDACHIALDRTGRCLFTAQYGTSSVATFPLGTDGTIGPRSALIKHTGTGPNKERQEAAHPHQVSTDSENKFLFVPDLGTDQIVIYDIDIESGQLKPHGHGKCPAGSGPRHFVFHPSGKFAYVVDELELAVTAFNYNAESGSLVPIQTISTLPDVQREGANSASAIRITPDGRYLYATNRGHDSIAAFKVDPESGQLTFVELEAVRGSHPRDFNIDPSGKWLLAAGRDSNTVSVFRIEPEAGALAYTGKTANSPAPICITFQPQK